MNTPYQLPLATPPPSTCIVYRCRGQVGEECRAEARSFFEARAADPLRRDLPLLAACAVDVAGPLPCPMPNATALAGGAKTYEVRRLPALASTRAWHVLTVDEALMFRWGDPAAVLFRGPAWGTCRCWPRAPWTWRGRSPAPCPTRRRWRAGPRPTRCAACRPPCPAAASIRAWHVLMVVMQVLLCFDGTLPSPLFWGPA
jgi:hypothetical protein